MDITVEMVMAVVTALVTYLFGFIAKKFKLVESKYIPMQNALIGLVAGLVCYCLKITEADMFTAIIYCVIGSMASGGTYDLAKISKGE